MRSEELLVNIGLITRPHGIKGAVKVVSLTADIKRFSLLKRVFIAGKEYNIETIQYSGQFVILKFSGIDSMNGAQQLKNKYICTPELETTGKKDGEFYYYELEGLTVVTETGKIIGKVEEVLDMPANTVLSVRNQENLEILLPFVKSVIKKMDIEKGLITIELFEGLIP